MKKFIFLLIVVAFSLCSCKSSKVVAPVVVPGNSSEDISHNEKIVHDSVYVHDSICTYIYKNADTVTIEKNTVKYVYKDRIQYDSIFVEHTDSIYVAVEVEVPVDVPADLSWWEDLCLSIGKVFAWILSFVCVGGIVLFISKFFK